MNRSLTTLEECVDRVQKIMAHAWVVRAFVRHSDEVEDFPELSEIDRAIFDLSRALETKVNDPVAYFKMLAKKKGKFGKSVQDFANCVPDISSHTNFAQAVLSMKTCTDDIEHVYDIATELSK